MIGRRLGLGKRIRARSRAGSAAGPAVPVVPPPPAVPVVPAVPLPLVPPVPVTLLLSSLHDDPIAAVVPTSENVSTRNCFRVISFFESIWMASG